MLPENLRNCLETRHNILIENITPLGGGCINQVMCLTTHQGKYCLKWNSQAPAGMFTSEAHGLNLIRSTGTIRVPKVVALSEPSETPAYIVLEWIESVQRKSFNMTALGEQLANLHSSSIDPKRSFGLEIDNFIGLTPQPNRWAADWPAFFNEHRLGYQANLAVEKGHMTPLRQKRVYRLLSLLDHLLPGRTDLRPSLLHGDLWSENVIPDSAGAPVLVDPACYYGDREAEIAYTELFGGFSPAFYAAYQSAYPLDPNYKDRRDLYNLYHLFNHLNLFGEMYASEVDRILAYYVG